MFSVDVLVAQGVGRAEEWTSLLARPVNGYEHPRLLLLILDNSALRCGLEIFADRCRSQLCHVHGMHLPLRSASTPCRKMKG